MINTNIGRSGNNAVTENRQASAVQGKEYPLVGFSRPPIIYSRETSRYPHHYMCQRGFTLIELMTVVVIATILFAVAIPNMRSFIQNNRIVTETNDFIADLNFARSEALKRNIDIVLCQSSNATTGAPTCNTTGNNWGIGWITYLDSNNNGVLDAGETVLRVHEPLPSDTTLNASATSDFANRVIYAKSGTIGAPPGGSIPTGREFDLCDTRGASQGRSITLEVTGRPTIARNPTSCTPP